MLRSELWLLLVEECDVINANWSRHAISESAIVQMELGHFAAILQMFIKLNENGIVHILTTKTVSDNWVSGTDNMLRLFVVEIGEKFIMGTVSHGPDSSVFVELG